MCGEAGAGVWAEEGAEDGAESGEAGANAWGALASLQTPKGWLFFGAAPASSKRVSARAVVAF